LELHPSQLKNAEELLCNLQNCNEGHPVALLGEQVLAAIHLHFVV
jgi:hypothetical protein